MPETFIAKPVEHAAKSDARQSVDLNQWWRSLRDRELNSLIVRALQSNLDLEIALTRLQEAQAQMGVTIGQALPRGRVDGSGGAGDRNGHRQHERPRASSLLRSGNNRNNLTRIDEVGGLSASWELDIFGKFRRRIEAADADAEALADRATGFSSRSQPTSPAISICRGASRRAERFAAEYPLAQNSLDLAQTRFNRGLLMRWM